MSNHGQNEKTSTVPLLERKFLDDYDLDQTFSQKVWIESKKLWRVVGPAIFSRIASYSMFVITQAFAGHLGELELAAMSIASNVILGFDFGLMVCPVYDLYICSLKARTFKKFYFFFLSFAN